MIVPMKRLTLYALGQDRRALLMALQRRAVVMVDAGEQSRKDAALPDAEAALADAEAALAFLKKHGQKQSLLAGFSKPEMEYDALLAKGEREPGELLAVRDGIVSRENRIQTLRASGALLRPWQRLEIPLNELKNTRFTLFHTGFLPDRAVPELQSVSKLGAAVTALDSGPSGTALFLAAHRADEPAVYERLKQLGFMDAAPPYAECTAAEMIAQNEAEIKTLETEITGLQSEAAAFAGDAGSLKQLRDRAATNLQLDGAAYGATDAVFYIEGWVRSDRLDALKEAVESVTDIYEMQLRDPEEGEKPPTVTKNNRFISQFETITDMFSRPGPFDSLDPNPVMGFWYWIIFGMMMGDVGYGLIMVILIGGFKLLTKNNGKMVNILFYSGFTSIFWGIMFGGYFGEELLPAVLFAPLDNIMLMMGVCLGIGALHVFSGLGMQMAIHIKAGRPWDAVFDQVSAILLIVGLILLFVSPAAGAAVAGTGGGLILLTAGRSKPKLIGKILGGFMGIYNTVTGLFSDILSYARILALMLSSGIVGMVMNILAGMVMPKAGSGILGYILGGIFGVTIYVVGHMFNLVLSLLSAYVHDSRLQYLEFFGKFYEGGGYAFRPLSPDTKYVRVSEKP